jgi:hypothetical protein
MWWQFFSQNVHFAVNLFAALVLMAIAWLYLDAWMGRHTKKELFKWVGFTLAALSFLAQATVIEQSVLGDSLLGNFSNGLVMGLRLVGYALIIMGHIIDPLQKIPKNTGLNLEEVASKKEEPKTAVEATPALTIGETTVVKSDLSDMEAALKSGTTTVGEQSEPADGDQRKSYAVMGIFGLSAKWLLPIAGFTIAGLYWRRATTGLERHLKRVAVGFLFIALSDAIGLASLLRGTDDPTLYSWVAAFGWVWLAGQISLFIGALIVGTWIWFYLTKRFFSQLFMVFITSTVIVFFVVTVSFTALLLRNIRADALTNLSTAANVLNYALDAKQAETRSGAQQIAANSDVVSAIQTKDHARLVSLTENYLVDKKQTGLVITNQSGQVLLRAQDAEQWGDSLSSDSLIRRSLLGDGRSSVAAYKSANSPVVLVRSAVPVRDAAGTIVGSVVAELELGSAFVDGIKNATGLQSSIYADNVLAATTVVSSDGKTRSTGVKLSNKAVTDMVLTKGQTFNGTLNLQNRELLGSFLPLKDVDNANIGMLMISQPQSNILRTAGRSIELTFLLTAALLIISIVPIYYVTKAIERQLD